MIRVVVQGTGDRHLSEWYRIRPFSPTVQVQGACDRYLHFMNRSNQVFKERREEEVDLPRERMRSCLFSVQNLLPGQLWRDLRLTANNLIPGLNFCHSKTYMTSTHPCTTLATNSRKKASIRLLLWGICWVVSIGFQQYSRFCLSLSLVVHLILPLVIYKLSLWDICLSICLGLLGDHWCTVLLCSMRPLKLSPSWKKSDLEQPNRFGPSRI